MRLIECIPVLVVLTMFSGFIFRFGSSLNDVSLRSLEFMRKKDSEHFISESFKNTCRGEGFSSFEEWQKVCAALWKLDYISFGDVHSFLPVAEGRYMYACWQGENGDGEVYSYGGGI